MAALVPRAFDGGRRSSRIALALAAAGALTCALGAARDTRQALFSFLTAFVYLVSIQLGALIFLMIVHLARARWMLPLRRVNEALAASLLVSALLFVPVLAGAGQLYPWVDAQGALTHGSSLHFLPDKRSYLNVPAFAARACLYFAVWLALALLLRRSSLAGDSGRARAVSAAGMPVLGLTLTFAAIDWIMSLEPAWFSSMFGIYYFAGGFVAAIALLVVLARAGERSGWLVGYLHPSHYYALGRMLLAFTIFWAYIAYFQFFLIYIADRPDEVRYFVRRGTGSWYGFGIALAIAHCALPISLLLLRGLKLRADRLAAVAAWLLLAHYLDVYFLVMPVLHADGVRPHWLDLAALVAVCGAAFGAGTLLLRGHALVPQEDPELRLGVAYRSE